MDQERVECIHCKELMIKGALVCPHCKLEQVTKNQQGFLGLAHKVVRFYAVAWAAALVFGLFSSFFGAYMIWRVFKTFNFGRLNFEKYLVEMQHQVAPVAPAVPQNADFVRQIAQQQEAFKQQ